MGAKISATKNIGDTALSLAESKGDMQCLKSHSTSQITQEKTALMEAVENFQLEKIKCLINSNACSNQEILSIPNLLGLVLSHIQQEGNVGDTEIELVRRICDSGVNVNDCLDSNGAINSHNNYSHMSAVNIVSEMGNYELADIVFGHGAKISDRDVVTVVRNNHTRLIPLLHSYGAIVIEKSGVCDNGGSILDYALMFSYFECAKIFISLGVYVDLYSAIWRAAHSEDIKTVEFLLSELGEETKNVIKCNNEFLCLSAKTGNIAMLKLLLDSGADINGIHKDMTPLMKAISLESIQFLLENGADVNKKTNTTALIHLFNKNVLFDIQLNFSKLNFSIKYKPGDKMPNIVRTIADVFLSYEINIEDIDSEGSTALHACVKTCYDSYIICRLLNKGANVNRQNDKGLTPLHILALRKRFDEMKTLLLHGADVNIKTNKGLTPLHMAVKSRDVVALLAVNNADINTKDNMGNTALLYALKNSNQDFYKSVRKLIEYGCDVNVVNNAGMSALLLAAANLHQRSMFKLIKSNAEVNYFFTVEDQPMTALSIVLNRFDLSYVRQRMAMTLLKNNATSKYVNPDVIHRCILLGNEKLVGKLILNGIGPTDIILENKLLNWPCLSFSPLMICCMISHTSMARFFIKNCYLTKSDLAILSRNKDMQNSLNEHYPAALEFLEEISSQPLTLEHLCCITVSEAIGSDPNRLDKFLSLNIPGILKSHLMHSRLEMEELNTKIDVNTKDILTELEKNQIRAKYIDLDISHSFEDNVPDSSWSLTNDCKHLTESDFESLEDDSDCGIDWKEESDRGVYRTEAEVEAYLSRFLLLLQRGRT